MRERMLMKLAEQISFIKSSCLEYDGAIFDTIGISLLVGNSLATAPTRSQGDKLSVLFLRLFFKIAAFSTKKKTLSKFAVLLM